MVKKSQLGRFGLKSSPVSIGAVCALSVFAGGQFASAQESQDAAKAAQLEEVVVTGSRIKRTELEATSPVLVIGSESLSEKGIENIADLAQQLPQFAPSFGSSRTQSTFSGAATSGLNLANLRNLGAGRTLVLINGRRVPAGTTTSASVDFNTIPTANIADIQVLTGGASSVYGADAVSGVINVITKSRFEGIEVGASYSESSEGDNKNPSGHIMFGSGFADGRGHAVFTAQLTNEGEVSCADRFLCAEDFFWGAPATQVRGPAAYSGVGQNGRFFTANNSYTRRGTSFTGSTGALIPFDVTVDGYNRNPRRTLAIPTKRVMFAGEGSYELAPSVRAIAEFNYGSAKTDAPFEGHPFQSAAAGSLFGGGPGVAGLQASIPLDNPFVPAALRTEVLTAAANAMQAVPTTITWWQRFDGFGLRGAENSRETVRGMVGFEGDLESIGGFGSDWTWSVSHVYGRTSLDSLTDGLVATDRLYYGLRVEADPARPGQFRCSDPGARALGCVPVNPFAAYTQDQISYLSASAGQRGRSQLEATQASLTGAIAELPGGSLRASIGYERRDASGFLDYDEQINRALVTGNQIGDVSRVAAETNEFFVEALVPVVRDIVAAKSLNLDLGYRRSSTEGEDYNTWKYGLAWSPLEDLTIRAIRNRAIRTPVPGELSGIGQNFGVVNDPCTAARRNANPTRAANCAAAGVPATYAPPVVVEQSVGGFVGGNPALAPEEATTLTYGIAWSPSFVPGLAVTLDRFQIELDGAINTVGRQTKTNLCFDSGLFCGDLTRGTNPAVPGATWVLTSVNDQLLNVASYNVRGYDLNVRYSFDFGALFNSESDFGKLNTNLIATVYDQAEYQALPGQPVIELLGFAGGSTSDQGYIKRQATLSLGYDRGPLGVNWGMRYVGKAGMSPFATGFPDIGSRVYHNIRVGWAFGEEEDSEIAIGVTNLFDKDPPFFASGTSGTQALDTIPAYYDVFGRQIFGSVTIKF
jgi:iron complex outermembrane recepter protein